MPFQYKRILLLGASSGIGEALAERFVKEGSYVIAVGRRKEKLAEFVNRVGNDNAAAVPFDISEMEKIPNFVQNITQTYPDLDCIFLNSGMQRGFDFSKPSTIDLPLFQNELLTNYTSFIAITTAFLPFLQEATHQTSLIYTTSNLAIVPIARCPGYCASKAALHHFILCLRSQLRASGDNNIKVLELLPPAVQTELHDEKHQPDIKDGRKIGMPLDEFTDQAYEALASGEETCLIGGFAPNIRMVEEKRQEDFWKIDGMMRGNK